jgi:DNA-binding NtrC family response regulator
MRRASSQLLWGSALVLYLLALAAAAQGELASRGVLVALFAGALCLAPLATRRLDVPGARRVGLLGLTSALALPRLAAPAGLSLTVDLAHVVAVAGLGGLVLELALCLPEDGAPPRSRRARRVVLALSTLSAGAGALAHGPPFRLLGQDLLAPPWLERVPVAWLVLALGAALLSRMSRGRLTGSPEALASNAWAVLGLVPAFCLGVVLVASTVTSVPLRWVQLAAGPVALLLVWGHARMLEPALRLRAGPAARDYVALALTLVLTSAAATLIPWPEESLGRGAVVACGLLLASGFYGALRALAHRLLAPASGRLLLAAARAERELTRAGSVQDVARVLLCAGRSAAGDDAEPILWLSEPKRQFRIDAAGQAHEQASTLPPALEHALRQRPGELLVRTALDAQIVRAPGLRPLIDALCALDLICVVPLVQQGEVEGALCLPRGPRTSALTLEELDALSRLTRYAAGFLGVLGAEARAQARASEAFLAAERAEIERKHALSELQHVRAEAAVLRAMGQASTEVATIAYDPKSRSLLERLSAVADAEVPVWLAAERGVPVAEHARLLHARGKRALAPFLCCECARLRPEQAVAELTGDGSRPGLLALAAGGTLLLHDVAALPAEAQRTLASALRDGWVTGSDGERRVVSARLVVSSRHKPSPGGEAPGVLPELRACFPLVLQVPALRERPLDLPSLILLALDRAARTLGRPALGLEPAAQARLLRHDWPGNLDELLAVIETAVARSAGPRVLLRDVLPLGTQGGSAEHPLDGSLEVVERRVLRRALERSEGNKSEAARILGLKRTTLIDKLRRHGLDETGRSLPPPPPSSRSN